MSNTNQDVRAKYVAPTTGETSFHCPHCGTLAKQFWYTVHADQMKKDDKPLIADPEKAATLNLKDIEDKDERENLVQWFKRMAAGRPFLETCGSYRNFDLRNVWLSRCYNCDDVALWIYDRLVWPCCGEAPLPNTDLPRDIIDDYNEASSILDLSPRGAAALLRLALQKLCKELGESGKDINADIAALVKRGLDVKVAQALDIVRVVGNCSVHPGQIDMKDNRETAEKLFRLINLIAERMISEPKHVNELFDSLPEPQRKAIQARDSMNRP